MMFEAERESRAAAVCLALFVAVTAATLLLVDGAVLIAHGADAASWYRPALGLVQHGGFVDPDAPSQALTQRPPLYPALVAASMAVAGTAGYAKLLAGVQLALLAATAALTAKLAGRLAPGLGVLAFALILFNPNSLGAAFFVQSETLFAFFVTLLLVALWRYAELPTLRDAALAGAAAALIALTRPEGLLLMLAAPAALPIAARIGGWRLGAKAAGGAVLICLLVSLAATAPWMARNAALGEGWRLTSAENTNYYVWGSAAQLEMIAAGVDNRTAEARMEAAREVALAALPADESATMSPADRSRYLTRKGVERILAYPPEVLTYNVATATLQFFTAGGAGRLFTLLGSPDATPFAVMVREGQASYGDAVLTALKEADALLLAAWVLALGYVVALRLLGLAGLWRLAVERRWETLFILAAGIAFFALVIPFYGISRFRIPAEPMLVLLAVAGAAQIRDRLRRVR